MKHEVPHEPPAPESEGTGLPSVRTWRGVYLFVLGCFVVYIALLAIFTYAFS